MPTRYKTIASDAVFNTVGYMYFLAIPYIYMYCIIIQYVFQAFVFFQVRRMKLRLCMCNNAL